MDRERRSKLKLKCALVYAQFTAAVIVTSGFFIAWMAIAIQFYLASTSSLLFTLFALAIMATGLAHAVMVGRYLLRCAKTLSTRAKSR